MVVLVCGADGDGDTAAAAAAAAVFGVAGDLVKYLNSVLLELAGAPPPKLFRFDIATKRRSFHFSRCL